MTDDICPICFGCLQGACDWCDGCECDRYTQKLRDLIIDWADAKEKAYHDEPEVIRAEDALRKAVGR